MFDSIGWGEVLVIVLAGLFILGPERLPKAAAWLGRSVRKMRDYANGARDQLRSELGPEFDELRQPLEDLRSLRDLNPRRAITKHLLDDYDPVEDMRSFDPRDELRVTSTGRSNGHSAGGDHIDGEPGRSSYPERPGSSGGSRSLSPGERPPFDPDAT